jgi:hypothetical protein
MLTRVESNAWPAGVAAGCGLNVAIEGLMPLANAANQDKRRS